MLAHPTFIEPSGPDARPIIELHRGSDGWIGFQRKRADGTFERLFNVRASELPELFPEFIAPYVDEESFFTLNAVHMSQRRQADRSTIEPSLPKAIWGASYLRHLTACYVDLDCYKLGITMGQAIGACIDAQDRGVFPPASLFTRSGRGVWLFWLLRDDDDPTQPVRAWPEKISTYRRIERALLGRFSTLGSDAKAANPAQITRVPGSIHRRAGRRVDYWLQLDKDKRPYAYRLDELAVRMGVRPTRYTTGIAQAVNPQGIERARRGYEALNRSRLDKLLRLIGDRGFIAEGCRNHAALLLACFLHKCGIKLPELTEVLYRFGMHQCRPALTEQEITDAIKKRKQYGQFGDHTIGDWLLVTPAEAERIGWPPKGSRPAEADTKLTTRADRRTTRRELLSQLIEGRGGAVPTIDAMCGFIEERMGDKPSTWTVHRDLAALNISNPRRRGRGQAVGPLLLADPSDGDA